MKITLSTSSPPLGGIFVAEHVKTTQSAKIEVGWGNTTVITVDNQEIACANSNDVVRVIARNLAESQLYGATPIEKTEVDHWLTYTLGPLKSKSDFICAVQYLNRVLGPITYFVGKRLTIADFVVFAELYVNNQWDDLVTKKEAPNNLLRWFNHIKSLNVVKSTLNSLPNEVKTALQTMAPNSRQSSERGAASRAQEGKFVDLPGAEMGKVVVRFPPEASGYLHIGHAKAALLNQYYQQAFEGKLIMRFDDTNPAKENVHFEKVILEDLEMLEIKPDLFTHTSQYFDLMLDYCERLLKDGKAYADDTEPEQMKLQREQKVESANRSNSYEKNMQLWSEMKKGTQLGQKCCIRAKIDMQSPNGCMRDPTIYRCKNEIHPRTGDKYKVYPTYDFACPIVDAIENVTHTLRTMEYHDRDAQFYWFIDALGLRKPYIWEYSRLSMTNTVLSKRKLTWFVENKLVDGWDDARFPTVRGVLRRGMTVEGLKQFIIAQGSSRSVVFMEWDKIWAFNKKVIDPIAPRYTAVDFESPVPVLLKGVKEEKLQVPKHPKNAEVGSKDVWVGPRILIDLADAETLKDGENATFINWGNLIINKINRENGKVVSVDATPNLDNKDYKKTIKLTWLAETESAPFTPTRCVYFEHIISKPLLGKDEDFKQFVGHETKNEVQMLGDPELKKLKKGDIIQLQRRGFFKVDVAYQPLSLHTCKETAIVLFAIPDGHTKESPTAGAPKATKTKQSTPEKKSAGEINEEIIKQGDLVRNLKNQKAVKGEIDSAVKGLLSLKAEYKSVTNTDWKPGCVPPGTGAPNVSGGGDCNLQDLNSKIAAQGDKIRELKAAKAAKALIDPEVKTLLSLKIEYKTLTGSDWKPGAVPIPAATSPAKTLDEASILEKIAQQGDKIRDLKSKKAEKPVVESEVKILLGLKNDYKSLTGSEWKPGAVAASKPAPAPAHQGGDEKSILEKIAQQGDKIRDLKSKKAEKSVVESEVKILLGLKNDYKSLTGSEWKPGAVAASKPDPAPAHQGGDEMSILEKIGQQGDKIRDLKSKKAEKSVVESEVKILLGLKNDYKSLTGNEWKPGVVAASKPDPAHQGGDEKSILEKIGQQGDKIRDLKSKKAEKSVVESEVKILLGLKNDYKSLTGNEWKPGVVAASKPDPAPTRHVEDEKSILEKIAQQGDKIRDLKSKKAEKSVVESEVKILLGLKTDYKSLTGSEWKPGVVTSSKPVAPQKESEAPLSEKATKQSKKVKPKEQKIDKKMSVEEDNSAKSGVKKQTKLGLEAKKEEDLPNWYSQVITKGELIEYYDVSGCYILRPWSFAIWEAIRDWFDAEIKKLGVQNCYFPIFVSQAALEAEKAHIADFSPEVAWVTKSGDSDLAEPVAVRPTSETGMYPAYAKWIQSHRDLPIKLNQWNNVVRWEFKHPQPFLRTREFLWQEGHTAFANQKEANEEVTTILDLYAKVYTDLLAIPVIKGRKTEKEKFAGGDYTLTIEGFISATGRGIQAATSHHLGQNFSKMFEIVFLDPETQEKCYVYQNSWGITTRTIGVMVMVHADNQGLVLPPRVASIQVIVVPCGMPANFSEADRKELQSVCDALESDLLGDGVRVKGDYRDNYSAGWKFNHWELKGVPIRVEVGPKDVKNKQVVAVRRDTGQKITIKRENVVNEVKQLLIDIQQNMFNKASEDFAKHTIQLNDWSLFTPNLNKKNVILAPFCGNMDCEDKIKADSTRDSSEVAEVGAPSMGAKSLCIPLDQPIMKPNTPCIHPECKNRASSYTLFGRSY